MRWLWVLLAVALAGCAATATPQHKLRLYCNGNMTVETDDADLIRLFTPSDCPNRKLEVVK